MRVVQATRDGWSLRVQRAPSLASSPSWCALRRRMTRRSLNGGSGARIRCVASSSADTHRLACSVRASHQNSDSARGRGRHERLTARAGRRIHCSFAWEVASCALSCTKPTAPRQHAGSACSAHAASAYNSVAQTCGVGWGLQHAPPLSATPVLTPARRAQPQPACACGCPSVRLRRVAQHRRRPSSHLALQRALCLGAPV